MTAHSLIGASSAKRWMACPGSVHLLNNHPMPSSPAAAIGTLAHELGENILHERLELETQDKEPSADLEQIMCEDYDEATIENVLMYVNIVWSKYKLRKQEGFEPTLHIERRVHLGSVHPDAFGTLDAAIICNEGPVDIFDYKNGRREVDVEDNPQAMYYAIGLQDECQDQMFTEFHLHIVQPNSGGHKEWQPTLFQLNEFAKELQVAADIVYSDNAPRIPGPQCNEFCNRTACPEYTAQRDEAATVVFGELNPIEDEELPLVKPDVSGMDVEQLGRLLELAEFMKSMTSDASSILREKAMRGEDVGNFKLIRGKGNYKLNADVVGLSKALKLPQAKLSDVKVKSKSAIEKVIKAEFKDKKARSAKLATLTDLCYRPDGEIKLVHKDHAGEDYLPTFEPIQLD